MTWLYSNFGMCVAALFFCCAAAALGQTTSTEVSARVGAAVSARVSPVAVDAQVHTMYSGVVAASSAGHALGAASWDLFGKALGGSEGVSVSAIRTRLTQPTTSKRVRSRLRSIPSHLSSQQLSRAASRYGFQGMGSGAVCSEITASAACGWRPVTALGKASYSEGFADSTRGTALLSPPDTGTSSPLEWSPSGFGSGELSFMPKNFLSPSLHVGAGIPGGHGRGSEMRQRRVLGKPVSSPLQSPLLQGNTLEQSSPAPSLLNPGSQGTGTGILSPSLNLDRGLGGGLDQ